MATRTVQFKIPTAPKQPDPFALARMDLGINVRDEQSNISDGQSPYVDSAGRPGATNIMSDGKGGITKRPGQAYVYATSLGAGKINGLYDYIKKSGTVKTLLAWKTDLYTQAIAAQPASIYNALADARAEFFTYGENCYVLDGTHYIKYDGTTAAAVVGYIPNYTTGRNPDGTGGAADESLNLLSNSWKDNFNGDVAGVAYTLSFAGLSVTAVKAWVNGVAKTETTDFTVDRTTGIVTFGTAPGIGIDNVRIQAEKANLCDPTQITKCRRHAIFGGANDTHVMLTDHPDYPSTVWYSYVDDPTYFPLTNYSNIGPDSDPNRRLVLQYDQLILLKERSIYRIEYALSSAGVASFPGYPLNDTTGCDMPDSVQVVDNYIVFCNSDKGPHIIEQTNLRTEKNVRSIGDLINKGSGRTGLLSEAKADLLAATSYDDGQHYILCIGSKCWAWNYKNSPWGGNADALIWWYWTNLNASCWLQRNGVTYYGDRTVGLLQKFIDNKNDNGVPINGICRTKLFNFGYPEWLKTIIMVYFRTNVTNAGSIIVTTYSDVGTVVYNKTFVSGSFNWATFRWDLFSWEVNTFDPVFRLPTKIKKAKYLALEFSNNLLNQDLSILDVKIYLLLTKKIK